MRVKTKGKKKGRATLHIFQELRRREDTQEQLGMNSRWFSLKQELLQMVLRFHCPLSLSSRSRRTLDLVIFGTLHLGEQVAARH